MLGETELDKGWGGNAGPWGLGGLTLHRGTRHSWRCLGQDIESLPPGLGTNLTASLNSLDSSPTCPQLPATPVPTLFTATSLPDPLNPFLSLLLQVMIAKMFLTSLLHFLILHPQMVGYNLDEAMLDRMKLHEQQLAKAMTWLTQELHHQSLEPVPLEKKTWRQAWGVLLALLLQQFSFWVVITILLLPWSYRRHYLDLDSSDEESSDTSSGEDEGIDNEDPGDRRPLFSLSAKGILFKLENQDYKRQVMEELRDF